MHGNVKVVSADVFDNDAGETILTVVVEFLDGPFKGQQQSMRFKAEGVY